ncbi:unnamed protein product [Cuscuta epithymum]|uniref:BRCT domain-containing protein n=2 Tax=Cuscuta epithymum TaxID=186058 RepID=A0AAV0CJ62_9ASTE|nr:unnamed protein product [Cuscuta epithymum]
MVILHMGIVEVNMTQSGGKKNKEDETNANFSDADDNTQPDDNQSFAKCGEIQSEADKWLMMQNTMHDDDPLLNGDGFETQPVDLYGDTQVLDFSGDTQVVEDVGETQVVYDHYSVEHMHTQVLDECNSEAKSDSGNEGSDRTEILGETQEISDDNATSLTQLNFQNTSVAQGVDICLRVESDVLSNKTCHAGPVHGGISNGVRNFNNTHVSADNVELDEVLGNENGCMLGSSAARKLFTEDTLDEIENLVDRNDCADDVADLNQMFASENVLAGLSYVDSQEPGDASQAEALDIVDKFLKFNRGVDDEDIGIGKTSAEKTKHVPSAKGKKSLAVLGSRSTHKLGATFDWDNNYEDEGGGEFFQKNKDLLTDKKTSSSRRKPRRLQSEHNKAVGDCGGEVELPDSCKKKDLTCSDSNVKLKSITLNVESEKPKTRGNCFKDLNKQLINMFDDVADDKTGNNDPNMTDVGIDTQMAAEVVQSLCYGSSLVQDGSITANSSLKSGANNEAQLRQSSSKKGTRSTRSATRQSLKAEQVIARAEEISKNAKQCDGNMDSSACMIGQMVHLKGIKTHGTRASLAQENHAQYNMRPSKSITDGSAPRYLSSRKKRRLAPSSGAADGGGISVPNNTVTGKDSKNCSTKSDVPCRKTTNASRANGGVDASPKHQSRTSTSPTNTPISCMTSRVEASPICVGDEYHRCSRRKSMLGSSLIRELNSLHSVGLLGESNVKDSRRRRDITSIRVLFSRHLDQDITRQQKKILTRLGASLASSMSDATHFVTDEFVRTRNILEAIALGKPVVTHLWLESCGQVSCLIDEKNYILRDVKKEREFGFSMPVSLARASQHPLLKDCKVFITPNTKPGREILFGLVKAVHGLPIERWGRSAMKDLTPTDGILILSCEDDYDLCVPFIEKGKTVYSSELLLNGIVTQKLEYERYELFTDHFKKTRSGAWVKKSISQNSHLRKS